MQWEWFGGICPVNKKSPWGTGVWVCQQKNHRLCGASGCNRPGALIKTGAGGWRKLMGYIPLFCKHNLVLVFSWQTLTENTEKGTEEKKKLPIVSTSKRQAFLFLDFFLDCFELVKYICMCIVYNIGWLCWPSSHILPSTSFSTRTGMWLTLSPALGMGQNWLFWWEILMAHDWIMERLMGYKEIFLLGIWKKKLTFYPGKFENPPSLS